MSDTQDDLREAGLAFYGGICASISHELKNSLALINENAGLMGDLVYRMRQGHPLDPEKVLSITERIAKHVGKANATIADLNKFGHLVDEPERLVNLYDAASLAVRLHQRPASQKQVELVLAGEDQGLELASRPFELGNALGLCIKAAIAAAPQRRVEVSIVSVDGGAEIRMSGVDPSLTPPSGAKAEALLKALNATLGVRADESRLTLGLKREPRA